MCWRSVGVVVVASLVGGCAKGLPVDSDGRLGRGTVPTVGAGFDPPARFSEAGRVRLPEEAEGVPGHVLFGVVGVPLPVALVGTTAYVASHRALLAVDVRTGRTVATIGPERSVASAGPDRDWNAAGPPVVVELDGAPMVVVPLLISVGGGKATVDVVGVEPGSHRRVWAVVVDVGGGVVPALGIDNNQWLAVVGVVDGVAVLRVGGVTVGVDLAGRAVVWQQAGFTGSVVVGDVVVGRFAEGGGGRVGALRVADGKRAWADTAVGVRLSVAGAGPRFVVVQGQVGAGGERFLRVVEAATGRVLPVPDNVAAAARRAGDLDGDGFACRYDGAVTTVCGAYWDDWNAGFDAVSGQWLWEIGAGTKGRTPVRLSAAWHGAVYGAENATRPVVLDARTGAVRARDAVAAPYLISGQVGVGPPVLGPGIWVWPVVA